MMGQSAPLVILPPACMAKYFIKDQVRMKSKNTALALEFVPWHN
jgi:hypothetical protein